MQVLHIETDGTAKVINLDDSDVLAGLQQLVGGNVACVATDTVRSGLALDIWANDEGLILGMDVNELGSLLAGQHLVGPVVLADVDDYGDTLPVTARHLTVLRDHLQVKVDDNKGAGYTLDAAVS